MFYMSLIISLVLLVASYAAARPFPHKVRWGYYAPVAVFLGVGPMCASIMSLVVFVMAIGLAIALSIWPMVRTRVKSFLPLSILVTVIAFSFGFIIAANDKARYDKLRQQYPFESMEERVPEPRPSDAMPESVETRLSHLEVQFEEDRKGHRASSLRNLHENTVGQFVNSPGFGVSRMMPPEYGLKYWAPEVGPREQRKPASSSHTDQFSAVDDEDLHTLHSARILDFINAPGFGFVKNRREVAGFIPHGFAEERRDDSRFAAARIDLIGMLLHAEPVVYLTDRLPTMEDARKAKTRRLDDFESQAMAEIRSGADLVPGKSGEGLRMVGAIRSARQCVECHGGKRGDLLGAFSYSLERVDRKR